MPLAFTSPPVSAIKFNEDLQSDCADCNSNFCLPLNRGDEIAFQVIFEAEDNNALNTLLGQNLRFEIAFINTAGTQIGQPAPAPDTVVWFNYPGTANKLLLQCTFQIPTTQQFLNLDCDKKLLIRLRAITGPENAPVIQLTGLSNCFVLECDSCYSTLLEYRNNEDAFGFVYCTGEFLTNKLRFPMYLSRPQFTDEEEVYFRSNGTARILSSVTRKLYDLITDNMPVWAHEALKLALSHDFTYVISDQYNGEIRKEGAYNIEWSEVPSFRLAPAQTAVNALPYNKKNTMCEDCEDCDVLFVDGDTRYEFDNVQPNNAYTIPLISAFPRQANCSPANGSLSELPAGIIAAAIVDGMITIITDASMPDFSEPILLEIPATCLCADATFPIQLNPPS